MTAKKTANKLPTAAGDAQAEALEQADEYESIFGNTRLELPNGGFIMVPPHPDYGMLSDERLQAWDEFQYEIDTEYEREPDVFIPEQKLDGLTLPAETRRGALLKPFRKKDAEGNVDIVRPPHAVRCALIALGDEEYAKLKAGGGNASDVLKIWGRQGLLVRERQQRDSKSAGGNLALAPISPADS